MIDLASIFIAVLMLGILFGAAFYGALKRSVWFRWASVVTAVLLFGLYVRFLPENAKLIYVYRPYDGHITCLGPWGSLKEYLPQAGGIPSENEKSYVFYRNKSFLDGWTQEVFERGFVDHQLVCVIDAGEDCIVVRGTVPYDLVLRIVKTLRLHEVPLPLDAPPL